jgi:hypothetical protein
MTRFLLLLFTLCSTVLGAQEITTDIFGNLVYTSERGNYKATLEKDIFNSLVFTDNRDNKITFEKKYIDLEYPGVSSDKEKRISFLSRLVNRYRRESEYTATYKVNIFDKVVIEDNRNKKIEYGDDIFGNPSYEETNISKKTSLKRDIFGHLIYQSGNEDAKLAKNIFDQWVYTDSEENELKFSASTWKKLLKRHRTEERIFLFLINSYLR